MDIEASSGRVHHKYAIPSAFLFGADGTLLWQHVDPNCEVRPSTAQLLGVLDAHGLGPAGAAAPAHP